MPNATEITRKQNRALYQACRCAKLCDDFRGEETLVLDLTKITPIFDYFVMTTAGSRRQMVSIAEEADKIMKSEGSVRLGTEGHESSNWILHDYGDVVLHIFEPDARKNYSLERLWADAESIDWREVLNSAGKVESESNETTAE